MSILEGVEIGNHLKTIAFSNIQLKKALSEFSSKCRSKRVPREIAHITRTLENLTDELEGTIEEVVKISGMEYRVDISPSAMDEMEQMVGAELERAKLSHAELKKMFDDVKFAD